MVGQVAAVPALMALAVGIQLAQIVTAILCWRAVFAASAGARICRRAMR